MHTTAVQAQSDHFAYLNISYGGGVEEHQISVPKVFSHSPHFLKSFKKSIIQFWHLHPAKQSLLIIYLTADVVPEDSPKILVELAWLFVSYHPYPDPCHPLITMRWILQTL